MGSAGLLGIIVVLLLVIVAGGALTWWNSKMAADTMAQLQTQMDTMAKRTDALEARPAPQPPVSIAPLQQRLATLEQQLGTVDKRVGAVETKAPPKAELDAAAQQQLAELSNRIDGIAARQDALGVKQQADLGKLNDQIAGLDSRLTAAAKASGEIGAINARQSRTAQLQIAAAALAAGRPLGTLDSAPPALAKFATAAPPTDASLRLSYDAAADEARRVGMPISPDAPFLTRLWDRAQNGIVVRQGDRVLVGDAVTGVLEHAKRLLEAGDLAGAVNALGALTGPAADAMAPWTAQAKSLLDARAALVTAARG